MAGNVKLIDPEHTNLNYTQVGKDRVYQENGIPQYQDMYISASLTAVRRGRTILTTDVATDITKYDGTSFYGDKVVSFMGQYQDPENEAHYNQFTTNWYDGSTETDKTYEGFGINSINIEINSSYIPQINIEFIDIRGLAFFNRENSPYRILFDFPPPIFYLAFKGYYGKELTYQMHLVKYNSEFKAETGNYHIDAKFIAITYAPLTDVPFRYILQAPLMIKGAPSLSPDSLEPPQNTLDLILKLEQVYREIPDRVKNDADNAIYQNAQIKLSEYDESLSALFNFNNEKILTDEGTPIVFVKNVAPNVNNQETIRDLNTYSEYNEYLQTFQTRDIPRNIDNQLYIGFYANPEVILATEDDVEEDGQNISYAAAVRERNDNYRKVLNKYRDLLIKRGQDIVIAISAGDIEKAKPLWENTEGSIDRESQYVRYVGLNITEYYLKLYKGKKQL